MSYRQRCQQQNNKIISIVLILESYAQIEVVQNKIFTIYIYFFSGFNLAESELIFYNDNNFQRRNIKFYGILNLVFKKKKSTLKNVELLL
ncbi:unnamed protein product [Paramecium pentaurelia]|uniref:Uncharacterized protein n=1 Tax=Paramecium pentaurelia TaxID=43138 RepID=A0A8S1V497_9CILI|nr:unnamed protein product [Paramecium pentaurelia]